jgi:hypothetical protein
MGQVILASRGQSFSIQGPPHKPIGGLWLSTVASRSSVIRKKALSEGGGQRPL